MSAFRSSASLLLSIAFLVIVFPRFSHAFGAGNIGSISKIEGQNWRHGDIEDTLLSILMARSAGGKKFSKMDVKRVYFGNWLRDYSQAIDVGTVKAVSAEAIRIILWILGFMSFGYGTKEFEVTTERLGCYRPEEHIDNPRDYADNIDARQYDRRLRGPVDERRELSIDPRTGLKMYIASEDHPITTSAGLVRNLFGRSIDLGRRYARSGQKEDLYEALRLMGTGCHCLEDYSAHSNYVELCLRDIGEHDVFPHVGRHTSMRLQGVNHPVFPIVTGTFGGVDFFHSVLGEVSDKTTQSEIQDLEGTVSNTENQENVSMIKELLNNIPPGILGGEDHAGKVDQLQQQSAAQKMQNTHITPRKPEAWTRYLNEVAKEVYPILEFHDNLMQSISETIEKIPILPEMIEKFQDEISVFIFSLLAPYVLPIIKQAKAELETGSSEVIQSSKKKQLVEFYDDNSTDPTHSMLSKDHFSNILNEPAGRVASQVLKWVVPQLMECWDNEQIDIGRTLTRIVTGVFHHPSLKDYGSDGASDGRHLMYSVVQQWWGEKSEREKTSLRDQLSRDGVEKGRNHKEGVHDQGHGCGKPLGMPNLKTVQSSGAVGGKTSVSALSNLAGASGLSGPGRHGSSEHGLSSFAAEAVGGGMVGGIVGGLVEQELGGGQFGEGGGRGGRQGKGHKKSSSGRQAPGDGYSAETYNAPPPQIYPQQQGGYRPQQEGYRPESYPESPRRHQRKEESEDSDSGDEYKQAKKERKKMEKEGKKKKKDHGDDDSDSDDRGSRGGKGRHSPPKGHSPGRGGEFDRYNRPAYANRDLQAAATGINSYSRMDPPRDEYNEGLAYGRVAEPRRDEYYEEGLAYGESGGFSRQERQYDTRDYDERAQYRQSQGYEERQQYERAEQRYDAAPYGGQQYGGDPYAREQLPETGYGREAYGQEGYAQESYGGGYQSEFGRGDEGYGRREEQRFEASPYEARQEYEQEQPQYQDEYREERYEEAGYDEEGYERRY